jgi:hypothetical protein
VLGLGPPLEAVPGLASWLAGQLDRIWAELGSPDPFVVMEVGAGAGELALGLLGARPTSGPALRYLLVEADASLAAAQQRALSLESSAFVLGPAGPAPGRGGPAQAEPDEDPPAPPPGMGPLLTSLTSLPAGLRSGVVVAIGWLSRLPADRYEWRNGRWWELRLAAGDHGGLVEMAVDAGGREPLVGAGVELAEGDRVADFSGARSWLVEARDVAESGRVLALDRLSELTTPLPPGRLTVALDQLVSKHRPRLRPGHPFPDLVAVEWDVGVADAK